MSDAGERKSILSQVETEEAPKTLTSKSEDSSETSLLPIPLSFSYGNKTVFFAKNSGILRFASIPASDLERIFFITKLRGYLKNIGRHKLQVALAAIQPVELRAELKAVSLEVVVKKLDTIDSSELRFEIKRALFLLQNANTIIKVVAKQEARKNQLELLHDFGHLLYDLAVAEIQNVALREAMALALYSDEGSFNKVLQAVDNKKTVDQLCRGYKYVNAKEVLALDRSRIFSAKKNHAGYWQVDFNFLPEFYLTLREFVINSKEKFLLSQPEDSTITPSASPDQVLQQDAAVESDAKSSSGSSQKKKLTSLLDLLVAEAEKENKIRQTQSNYLDSTLSNE